MVLLGLVLILAASHGGFRLNRALPAELRGRWRRLTFLMILAAAGYLLLALMLWTAPRFPIELPVALVLLGCSILGFMFSRLAGLTVARLHDMHQGAMAAKERLLASNAVQAEQSGSALREAKTRIENIFHNSIPLGLTNLDFAIIDANEAYCRIFGKPTPGKGQKCYESRPGPTCNTPKCPLTLIVAGASEVIGESRKVTSDGAEHSFMVTARPFRDADGAVVGIVESFQDITRLKRAEAGLAEGQERLRVILKSIADGVIAADLQGRVLLLNDTAQALTGWRQESAVGRELAEILHLRDVRDRRRAIDPLASTLPAQTGEESGGQALCVARDGCERSVRFNVAPIHDRRHEVIGFVLGLHDVTEKLKVAAEAARMQKLESVALLAGGVAHDFNNVLTAIMNNLALAKLMDSREQLLEKIDATETAVLKAKELTGQLLTFAKGGAPVKETLCLGHLVRDCVAFNLHGSNVGSDITVAEGLRAVAVDGTQMHQVISNLVINADQAMPDGGIISIALTNCVVGPEDSGPVRAGSYVKLNFRDQGQGVSEDRLGKIFDPYFTTKPEGSGLGLATVNSIIAKHDGYIFVESGVGRGTEFTIYLPAAVAAMAVAEKVQGDNGVAASWPAGRRILIMDDEADIRELLGELLQVAGFAVVAAGDGREAIRIYQEARLAGQGFDCVIMDLTVPGGMGGKEALGRLLKIDPAVQAIVSSGYANDPVMADYRGYGFVGRVAKPYQLAMLMKILHGIVVPSAG
jgi:PAS domain S-box-containing protein